MRGKLAPRHERRLTFILLAVIGLLVSVPGDAGVSPDPSRSHVLEETPAATAPTVLAIESEDIEAWDDPGGVLSADQVFGLPRSAQNLVDAPTQHYVGWRRVSAYNPEKQDADWVVRVVPSMFLWIEVYAYTPQGERYFMGRRDLGGAGEAGSLDMPMPAFRIHFKPGVTTLVIHTRAADTEQFALYLDPVEEAFRRVGHQHAIMGLYFGVLGALAAYNVLVWSVLRLSFISQYLLFMLSWGLLAACLHGYIDFLFPSIRFLTGWVGPFTHFGIISGTVFGRTFLKTRQYAPGLDTWHRIAIGFSLAMLVIFFTPIDEMLVEYLSPLVDLFVGVQTAVLWITGIMVWIRGYRPARMFTLGWSASLVGIFITILIYRGTIEQNDFTRFSIQYSSVVEMILLSFAIGARLRQMDQENFDAIQAAAARDRLRSLVGLVVHDLSSPMGAIQLQAELGARGGPFEWKNISAALSQQRSILDFARKAMAEDHAWLSTGQGDVTRSLASIREMYAAKAASKDVVLEFPEGQGLSDLRVILDETILVNSVLGNVVGNAIKFSPSGTRVSVQVNILGRRWLEIIVEDSGIGIPVALQAKIRTEVAGVLVHRDGTDGEPGTGHGLTLVRHWVESVGGRLEIISRAAEDGFASTGTRIAIWLPRA